MLGRGVDELDIDLLGLPGFGSWEDRFSHDDWSLSGTHDTTLNKKEVLVHLSVVWESTKLRIFQMADSSSPSNQKCDEFDDV